MNENILRVLNLCNSEIWTPQDVMELRVASFFLCGVESWSEA
jgi:hypothetical protein